MFKNIPPEPQLQRMAEAPHPAELVTHDPIAALPTYLPDIYAIKKQLPTMTAHEEVRRLAQLLVTAADIVARQSPKSPEEKRESAMIPLGILAMYKLMQHRGLRLDNKAASAYMPTHQNTPEGMPYIPEFRDAERPGLHIMPGFCISAGIQIPKRRNPTVWYAAGDLTVEVRNPSTAPAETIAKYRHTGHAIEPGLLVTLAPVLRRRSAA